MYGLKHDRIQDAINIFKLNIEIYPDYANGYDSLGEAVLAGGSSANGSAEKVWYRPCMIPARKNHTRMI